MDFAFSAEQDEFRATLRRFFEEKAKPADVRRAMASPAGYDAALWRELSEGLGLTGVHLSESFGGQGAGFLELGIALEEMGRVLLPSPFFASAVLATQAIRNAGSDAQQRRWLPSLAAGAEIATLAVAEARGGWDAAAITALATPDGGVLALDGAKSAVLSGDAAQRIVVAARLPGTSGEDGVTLCSVDAGAPGVKVLAGEPLDPTRRVARVELSGARAEALGLPGAAWPALRKTLAQAAIALSAEMVGGTERALELTVAYAKQRIQFARPIGSFQALKHKAADVLIELELARAASYWAWWVADNDRPELAEAAALAKSSCGDAFTRAAAECVQIHGGIGFTWEHDAQLYYKRAKVCDALLGDAAQQRAALAVELGF